MDRMRTQRFRWAYPWICGANPLWSWRGNAGLSLSRGSMTYCFPRYQSLATLLLMFWLLSGEGGLLRRILGVLACGSVGDYSTYSLYIWQQLFILAPRNEVAGLPRGIFSCALAAAIVSYRHRGGSYAKTDQKWFSQPQIAH